MFLGSTIYSMRLSILLEALTGSDESKIASFKPEIPIPQIVDEIQENNSKGISMFSPSSYSV